MEGLENDFLSITIANSPYNYSLLKINWFYYYTRTEIICHSYINSGTPNYSIFYIYCLETTEVLSEDFFLGHYSGPKIEKLS